MLYDGPADYTYYLRAGYAGGDPPWKVLYRGDNKEKVSQIVSSCTEKVSNFKPRGMNSFTLWYKGRKYLEIESVIVDGVHKAVRNI